MTRPAKVQRNPTPTLSSPFGMGGTTPMPALDDISDVDTSGVADGDALVWDDGTDTWVPGSAGGGTPATTVTDETTFGISPAVGTDTEYARQDHTHGTPSTATLQAAGHYEVMMDGGSPPAALESGSGTDWLYVWVS